MYIKKNIDRIFKYFLLASRAKIKFQIKLPVRHNINLKKYTYIRSARIVMRNECQMIRKISKNHTKNRDK